MGDRAACGGAWWACPTPTQCQCHSPWRRCAPVCAWSLKEQVRYRVRPGDKTVHSRPCCALHHCMPRRFRMYRRNEYGLGASSCAVLQRLSVVHRLLAAMCLQRRCPLSGWDTSEMNSLAHDIIGLCVSVSVLTKVMPVNGLGHIRNESTSSSDWERRGHFSVRVQAAGNCGQTSELPW